MADGAFLAVMVTQSGLIVRPLDGPHNTPSAAGTDLKVDPVHFRCTSATASQIREKLLLAGLNLHGTLPAG